MVETKELLELQNLILSYAKMKESQILLIKKYKFEFILIESTDLDLNRFNLYLSANWIDNLNSFELKKELFDFFRKNANEDINILVRAVIFVHTTDYTVQYIKNTFNFNNQNFVFLPSLKVGDNLIENAYLFNTNIIENIYA